MFEFTLGDKTIRKENRFVALLSFFFLLSFLPAFPRVIDSDQFNHSQQLFI
jgi:hypothetical protein